MSLEKWKHNSEKTAVITAGVKWMPIDHTTPVGSRMLLIDDKQGDGFTHWHPLPTF